MLQRGKKDKMRQDAPGDEKLNQNIFILYFGTTRFSLEACTMPKTKGPQYQIGFPKALPQYNKSTTTTTTVFLLNREM